jgi:hypothetical protein
LARTEQLNCRLSELNAALMLKMPKSLSCKPSERDDPPLSQRHANQLKRRYLDAPLQWFNFYPFWNEDDDTAA